MATLTVTWNDPGLVLIGAQNRGDPWTGGSGTVIPFAFLPSECDVAFTGATSIALGSYYSGATSGLTATLMDSSGAVLSTNTPLLVAATFVNTPTVLFAGLTIGTAYWLRIVITGTIFTSSANFLQLIGTGTPVVSLPLTYGPLVTLGNAGGTDISTHAGLEGNAFLSTVSSWPCVTNKEPAGAMLRIKGQGTSLLCYAFNGGGQIHVSRLLGNGSSGVPLDAGTTTTVPSGGSLGSWFTIATGMAITDPAYIYEINLIGSGGVDIVGLMLAGGTGVDTTVSSASLTRSNIVSASGDSIVCSINGTNGNVQVGGFGLFGQSLNKQVVNAGIPGQSMQNLSSGSLYTDITGSAAGVPSGGVWIACGINDIKSGSPPTATVLSGYMITYINKIRAVGGGWATVPIYVVGILPYSGMTQAAIDVFNTGANGYQNAVVAAYNAGIAAGQNPSPDPNVFYVDTKPWAFAGVPYETGGSFNGALYDGDGLHPNSIYGTGNPAASTPASGYYLYFQKLSALFGGPATSYTQALSSSTGFTGNPVTITYAANGATTATVTPNPSPGIAGSYSPTTINLNGAAPVTQTFTPTAAGVATLVPTNNGGLTSPAPNTYTVTLASVSSTLNAVKWNLVGVGTLWTGTPFTLVSGGGSITQQTVTDNTHATLTITGGTSPWVVSDGSRQFTLKASASGSGGGLVQIFVQNGVLNE